MNESELLGVLVEFSIGLGGFSAIATAFIHRNQSMSGADVYRVLNLLMMALGPAFIALFTLGLLNVSLPIQYGNALLFIFALIGIIQSEVGKRRLAAKQKEVLISSVIIIMQTIFFINGSFQILSFLNFLHNAFIILYGGLVVILAQAVVQFVRLIVARPQA